MLAASRAVRDYYCKFRVLASILFAPLRGVIYSYIRLSALHDHLFYRTLTHTPRGLVYSLFFTLFIIPLFVHYVHIHISIALVNCVYMCTMCTCTQHIEAKRRQIWCVRVCLLVCLNFQLYYMYKKRFLYVYVFITCNIILL